MKQQITVNEENLFLGGKCQGVNIYLELFCYDVFWCEKCIYSAKFTQHCYGCNFMTIPKSVKQ